MISRVYLQNWKSHHETELTFSEGVNALVGEMGSGKSSVVEAIIFALYGTTSALQSRKVTLDKVIRRSPMPAKECVVEVDFMRDGDTYTVRREVARNGDTAKTDTSELRKNNTLIEAPQATEVTEKVEQILDIDYELFSRSIYSEQNQLDYFLTLRAGERKRKVDDLLQLNRFEDARKTLVSLINRLEDRREDREDDLENLKDDLDEDAIEKLKEQLDEEQDALAEKNEELEELQETSEDVKERFEELEEKKERFEGLKEKRTALKTRIETVTEQIREREEELSQYATLSEEALEEKQEEFQEKKKALKETKEELEELEKQMSVLNDRKEQHEKKMKTLKEKKEKVEQLENVSEALEEKTEDLEELKKREQEYHTRMKDVKDAIKKMSKAAERTVTRDENGAPTPSSQSDGVRCPTCGRELTDEHRVEFLQEKKAEKQELEENLEELSEKKKELSGNVDELQEKKEELLQYKNVQEEIEDTRENLENLAEKLEKKTEKTEELEEDYSEDRLEELDKTLSQLDAAADLLELKEEREERVEQLEQVQETIEDVEFDEDTLETVREKKNELEKQQEVLKNDIENKQEMLEERKKRLEELEQKTERIEEYETKVEAYRRKNDMLNDLLKALESTQVDLRNQFIDSVNELMDDIWQQVYPYDDYESIRLNASDGYVLEVLDTEGNWISVDGEVSGGERHSAALTLRVALSILLTPNWRMLILDEPTHNLDVTAIEELSETLRTEVSDIVGQLFVITHEERLETAVTGELYKLSKKDTETGLTEIEQMTGA